MLVVGVSGTPKKEGNTTYLVKKCLECFGSEGQLITLCDKKISPCDGCMTCKSGVCRIRDDMEPLYEVIKKADAIIIGSPNYFQGVNGLTRNFLDRLLPLYWNKDLKFKLAAGISVGKFTGSDSVLDEINRFATLMGMIYVGGTTGIGLTEREVLHDMNAMRNAANLGERIKELKEKMK